MLACTCINSQHLLPFAISQEKDLSVSTQDETKALGVLWKPKIDSFSFKVFIKDQVSSQFMKKAALSVIAGIFDPLGLISRVIMKAKSYCKFYGS